MWGQPRLLMPIKHRIYLGNRYNNYDIVGNIKRAIISNPIDNFPNIKSINK